MPRLPQPKSKKIVKEKTRWWPCGGTSRNTVAAVGLALVWVTRMLFPQRMNTSSLLLMMPDTTEMLAQTSNMILSATNNYTATAKATATDNTQPPLQNPLSTPTSSQTTLSPANDNTKIKIVGFTDHVYKDVSMLWYDRLTKLGYTEHVIVAVDEPGVEFFKSKNGAVRFESMLLSDDIPPELHTSRFIIKTRILREMMFAIRWKYILSQLEQGISIIMTDVDNIFNSHVPLADFMEYDVIHAYESRHPEEIFARLGFVVCGGMSFFKASKPAIHFVRLMFERCGRYCDDQTQLNSLILDLNITWDSTDHLPRPEERQDMSKIPSKSMIGTCSTTGHSVKIWDRSFAYRGVLLPKLSKCPANNWVAMPFPIKSEGEKWGRANIHVFKQRMYAQWDSHCGQNNTHLLSLSQ